MNVADSEVVAAVMQTIGYEMTDRLEEADAVFLNTCSIRDNAEQKILSRLQFFQNLKKKKKSLLFRQPPKLNSSESNFSAKKAR